MTSTTFETSKVQATVAAMIEAAGGWDAVVAGIDGAAEREAQAFTLADDLRNEAAKHEAEGASLLQAQALYAVGASKWGAPMSRQTIPEIQAALGVSKAKAERYVLLGIAFHADIDPADVRGLLNDITVCRNIGGTEAATVPALMSADPVRSMATLRKALEASKAQAATDAQAEAETVEASAPAASAPVVEADPFTNASNALVAVGGGVGGLLKAWALLPAEERLLVATAWAATTSPVLDAIRAAGITRQDIQAEMRRQDDAAKAAEAEVVAEAEAVTEEAATASV